MNVNYTNEELLNIIEEFINSEQMKYIDFRDIFYNNLNNYTDYEYKGIHIKKMLIEIFRNDKYINICDNISDLLKNYYEINDPQNPNRYIYMDFKDLQRK